MALISKVAARQIEQQLKNSTLWFTDLYVDKELREQYTACQAFPEHSYDDWLVMVFLLLLEEYDNCEDNDDEQTS